MISGALRGPIDGDWVFDLDNTLYPAESTLYDALGARMTAYIADLLGISADAAFTLQERYFHQYGATIVGMVEHHGIDSDAFLRHVHDIDVSDVAPDPELAALLKALPGRKFVFTNGGGGHAARMVAQIGLGDCFDGLFDISDAGLAPKPQVQAYARLIDRFAIDPKRAVMIEDTLRNLEPAHAMGFSTVLVGPVHPDPAPAYVDVVAGDVKAFLRHTLGIDRDAASA